MNAGNRNEKRKKQETQPWKIAKNQGKSRFLKTKCRPS